MKNVVMFLVISLGVIAQMQAGASSSTSEPETARAAAMPSPGPEASKTARVYPIAAGVWYPGDPLPEKPFRYYRVRCWPGCHHNSEYGKYQDQAPAATPARATPEQARPKTDKASGTQN